MVIWLLLGLYLMRVLMMLRLWFGQRRWRRRRFRLRTHRFAVLLRLMQLALALVSFQCRVN